MNSFSRFEDASKIESQSLLINVEMHSIYLNFLMTQKDSQMLSLS